MFHSGQLLSREGPLNAMWVAAFTTDRGLKKRLVQGLDLDAGLSTILATTFSDELDAVAMRLSGQLLFGATRIYGRRVEYLLQDAVHQQSNLLHTLAATAADNGDPAAAAAAAAGGGGGAAGGGGHQRKLLPKGKDQAPLGAITVGGLQLRAAPDDESDRWLMHGLEQLQEGEEAAAAAAGGGGKGVKGLSNASAWHLGALLRRDSSKDLYHTHPGDAGDLFPLEPTPLESGDLLLLDPLSGDIDMFDIPEEEALRGGLLAPLVSGQLEAGGGDGEGAAGGGGDGPGTGDEEEVEAFIDGRMTAAGEKREGLGEVEAAAGGGGVADVATPKAAAPGGRRQEGDAFTTPVGDTADAAAAAAAAAGGGGDEEGVASPGAQQRQAAGRLEGRESEGLPKRRLFDQQEVDYDQQEIDQQQPGDVDMAEAGELLEQGLPPAAAAARGHQVAPGDTGDAAAEPQGRPRQRRRVSGSGPALIVDTGGQQLERREILDLLNNRAPLLREIAADVGGRPLGLRRNPTTTTTTSSSSSSSSGRGSLLVAAVQQQGATAEGGVLGMGDIMAGLPEELLQLLPGASGGALQSPGAAAAAAAAAAAGDHLLVQEEEEEWQGHPGDTLYEGQTAGPEGGWGADMELGVDWRGDGANQQPQWEEAAMFEVPSEEEQEAPLEEEEEEAAPGDLGEYPRRHSYSPSLLYSPAGSTEDDATLTGQGAAAWGVRALLERQRQLHRLLADAAAGDTGDAGDPGDDLEQGEHALWFSSRPASARAGGGGEMLPCGVPVLDLVLCASPTPPASKAAAAGGSSSKWAAMRGTGPSSKADDADHHMGACATKPDHHMGACATTLYGRTGAGQRLQVSRAFYDLLCLQSAGKVLLEQQVQEAAAQGEAASHHGVVVAMVAAA